MTYPQSPQVEIVLVARNQQAQLKRSVRAVHREASRTLTMPWHITIVDNASSDSTSVVATEIANRMGRVSAMRADERLDRKMLRSRFEGSGADTVAFLTVHPDAGYRRALAPLRVRARLANPRSHLSRRSLLLGAGGIGIGAFLAACASSGGESAGTTASTTATTAPPSTAATAASSTTAAAATTVAADTTATTVPAASATTAATATTAAPATTGAPATTAAPSTTPTVDTSSVTLAQEMTEGPYYLDLDLVRSDITEDRSGAAMALTMAVIDVGSGSPIEGAAVDIWHCDAEGLYSGFVSQSAGANGAGSAEDSGTFLRGTQLTDAAGNVTFGTIYPGWYRGRTVHIHLKVHVEGREIHTGQLFFDDDFTDSVFASTAPYSSRGEREVRNSNDNIYTGGGASSTVSVASAGDGYAGVLALGVAAS